MQKLILLIDDDQDEYFILEEALQAGQLPHYCVWANGLQRALHLLHQMQPDIILIDYNMPEKNGIDILRTIRSLPNLRTTPAILYSNYVNDVNRELALTQGASCMQKPATIGQLVEFLAHMNGGNRQLQPHL